jgi:hypothetical protein
VTCKMSYRVRVVGALAIFLKKKSCYSILSPGSGE